MSTGGEVESTRSDRRKAATRAKIAAAAEELFATRGYEEVSVEDIAALADVAVRTIYLHFQSKASIMLAQFDGWLDAFVEAINARPIEEPIAQSMRHALARLDEEGWPDRNFGSMEALHPMADLLTSGNPEIAGHVMYQWALAQDRIAASAAERLHAGPGDMRPRARAGAAFSVWTSTILMVRDGYAAGTLEPDSTGNRLGADLIAVAVPPTL